MVTQSIQSLKQALETASFQESFDSQMHRTQLILARISRANLIIRVALFWARESQVQLANRVSIGPGTSAVVSAP
uniref:Uncharacterized protein n=1 Tax=Solanum lycopersicum TaxID=4081 RepID=A0A3Q7GAA3_SOLLC